MHIRQPLVSPRLKRAQRKAAESAPQEKAPCDCRATDQVSCSIPAKAESPRISAALKAALLKSALETGTTVSLKAACYTCGGSGWCHMCNGSGRSPVSPGSCDTCGGSKRCSVCRGSGDYFLIADPATKSVTIQTANETKPAA